MKVTTTPFAGLLIIEPQVFTDIRGHFYESYNKKKQDAQGIGFDFVQDNQSRSVRDVIRGLHYQIPPHAQTKLVRALLGRILDVVIDLRRDQPTFGKSFSLELSSENKMQLLIPKGFAHGFSVLSDDADVLYKCDDYYQPEFEKGIRFDDPALDIDWQVDPSKAIVSGKDRILPLFSDASLPF
jgi:dTDP-4-dehydrorhamnose 3,5-epimerase